MAVRSTAPYATNYTNRTPPVNARLVRVSSMEFVSDGGGGWTEVEVERWSGEAQAFVTERNDYAAEEGDRISHAYIATVIVPSELAVAEGELITYQHHLGGQEVRRVDATENRSDYGYTRLFMTSRGE